MAGKHWAGFGIAALGLSVMLLAPAAAAAPLDAVAADRLRIQEHLARVEQQLRDAPVEQLAPAARLARARSLDELRRYWQAGVFPRNSRHPNQRRPYFIDDDGRACAVGALIQRSGHEALARRIDEAFHDEYVPNMSDPELLTWAREHGFSVAELALIQPEYCACGTGFDTSVGGQGGGATEERAAYRPVCGSNGLTYWNECIAEVCGGVQIVAQGECAHEAPCELCGTGERFVAVSECTQDAPTGICDLDFSLDVVPVTDQVAVRWLTLQRRGCNAPDYDLSGDEYFNVWQPAHPPGSSPPRWDCTESSSGASSGGASNGGASNGGVANGGASNGGESNGGESNGGESNGGVGTSPELNDEPSGGCTCAAAPSSHALGVPLGVLVLGLLRARRFRAARRRP